jgi:hypothetical protein
MSTVFAAITQHIKRCYHKCMKNKALAALEPLVGEWEYTMYNCWFLESLDTEVKGFTTIERLQGAFVVLRSSDADKKPSDVWVIGYSDPQEKYQMFYYDERGVSRIFNVDHKGNKMVFWREDKDFYQRMTLEIKTDSLHTIAEASDDKGKTWRKDLEMTHVKAKSS